MCTTSNELFYANVRDNGIMKAFKAVQLFSPHKMSEMHPSAGDINMVLAFPFFNSDFVVSLQAELPTYLSLSADVDANVDVLNWWKHHHKKLPQWSLAAL